MKWILKNVKNNFIFLLIVNQPESSIAGGREAEREKICSTYWFSPQIPIIDLTETRPLEINSGLPPGWQGLRQAGHHLLSLRLCVIRKQTWKRSSQGTNHTLLRRMGAAEVRLHPCGKHLASPVFLLASPFHSLAWWLFIFMWHV